MSDWNEYTVQDLIDMGWLEEPLDGNHGAIHPKTSEYVQTGVPFIMATDGKVFYKVNIIHIELYTDAKDPEVERQVEAVLDEHGIFYDKTEVWIDTEKLYEVLYSFQLEG